MNNIKPIESYHAYSLGQKVVKVCDEKPVRQLEQEHQDLIHILIDWNNVTTTEDALAWERNMKATLRMQTGKTYEQLKKGE